MLAIHLEHIHRILSLQIVQLWTVYLLRHQLPTVKMSLLKLQDEPLDRICDSADRDRGSVDLGIRLDDLEVVEGSVEGEVVRWGSDGRIESFLTHIIYGALALI